MTEYGKWRSLIDGAGVIPDSVVEDWERSTPLNDYSNVGSNVSVSQTNVWEGDGALKLTQDTTTNYIYTTTQGNLPGRLPEKGDAIGFLCYYDGTTDFVQSNFFGVQDGSNGYLLYYSPVINEIRLRKVSGGGLSNLDVSSYSGWRTGWYYQIGRWHDAITSEPEDTIEYEVYELSKGDSLAADDLPNPVVTASGSDSSFATETGVGFGTGHDNSNAEAWVDFAHIRGDADA